MQGDKEPPSTQPDSNVRFTAYVPARIIPSPWYTALVYVHLPAADAQVRAHSLNRLGSSIGGYQHEASGETSAIRRGAEIVIVPELPGCTFNPAHARLLWLEDWHAAEFRFTGTVGLQASPTKQITGHISFFVEPILIADIKLSIRVIETESISLEPEATDVLLGMIDQADVFQLMGQTRQSDHRLSGGNGSTRS